MVRCPLPPSITTVDKQVHVALPPSILPVFLSDFSSAPSRTRLTRASPVTSPDQYCAVKGRVTVPKEFSEQEEEEEMEKLDGR